MQFNFSDKSQHTNFEWINPLYEEEIKQAGKTREIWRRLDHKGARFYYLINPDNTVSVAAGVTSVLKKYRPTSQQLIQWVADKGDDYQDYMKATSEYGTLSHYCYTAWLRNRFVPSSYFELAETKWGKGQQLRRDMRAFARWVEDYKVEPIFIEGLLGSDPYKSDDPEFDGHRLCAAIDLLCYITIKEKTKITYQDGYYKSGPRKGEEKWVEETKVEEIRVLAIVDFKSNFEDKEDKQQYNDHQLQLLFHGNLVRRNFGYNVQHLYNWSPVAYKTDPKYKFTRYEIKTRDIKRMSRTMLEAWEEGGLKPHGVITEYPDDFGPDFESQVRQYTYEEYALEAYQRSLKPEQKL